MVNIEVDTSDLDLITEGAAIDLICESSLNIDFHDNIDIVVNWSRNGVLLYNNSNYTINPVSMVVNSYIGILQVHEVVDNGDVYSCNVRFESSINPMFINASEGGSDFVLNIGSELCGISVLH